MGLPAAFLGEGVQGIEPPTGEDESPAAGGESTGEGLADAPGGPDNQTTVVFTHALARLECPWSGEVPGRTGVRRCVPGRFRAEPESASRGRQVVRRRSSFGGYFA